MMPGRALAALALALGVTALGAAGDARAQVVPNAHWRTIDTKHFHGHVTPALEPAARRAAVSAERERLIVSTVRVTDSSELLLVQAVEAAQRDSMETTSETRT